MAKMTTMPTNIYNVITVTCLVTGDRYVGARNKDHWDLRNRANRDAENPYYHTWLVESIRQHGDENHVYKMVATGLTKDEARAYKVRLVMASAKKGKSLTTVMPRGEGLPTRNEFYLEPIPVEEAKPARKRTAKKATKKTPVVETVAEDIAA